MCGISGFVGGTRWREAADPAWVHAFVGRTRELAPDSSDFAARAQGVLEELAGHWDDLTSFALHRAVMEQPELRAALTELARGLDAIVQGVRGLTPEARGGEVWDRILERARDYHWQVEAELLAKLERSADLLPGDPASATPGPERLYVSWVLTQVLENIDRLEVRGRDSAGISLLLVVPADFEPERELAPGLAEDLTRRLLADPSRYLSAARGGERGFGWIRLDYKVANVIGRLGDNTNRLRELVRTDELLWTLADRTERVSVIAHTRWASNGIISLPNCHPIDGLLEGEEAARAPEDAHAVFVLNGDVDNYAELCERLDAAGQRIDARVTTDAKLPPVLFRCATPAKLSIEDRFADVVGRCEGSLAIAMQHPGDPGRLFLAQKGSGQALFTSRLRDGWVVASEIYGLAAQARETYPLSGTEKGGMVLVVDADAQDGCAARHLEGAAPASVRPRPIEIYARDIFRGDHAHYLEKELAEAPDSIRKTIRGKYRKEGEAIRFLESGSNSFEPLMRRLADPSRRPIDEVLAIGQGTASIAAQGIAYLVGKALEGSGVRVHAAKASEFSFVAQTRSLDSMLLIPVSQSGTTTDTNRTVDLAASRGAWVHAVVNRRDSPLINLSNSHTYTSDGRDIEMAVASTKAFYSQVAAGKLISLLLGQALGTLDEEALRGEIRELESLPDKIEQVLSRGEEIGEIARRVAPQRPNWAVVGNGPNKVAAEEIRIKISELCYKSIPCDYTEDKKHIDLSTEPLTLVVANDLPEGVVQDTAKEVAIFGAHGGRPIVLCTRGETRFDRYAHEKIELPPIGADLGFVLATAAGHLWGYHAAMAIDTQADEPRRLRTELTACLEGSEKWDTEGVRRRFAEVLRHLANGGGNASLAASTAARIAVYAERLRDETNGEEGAHEELVRDGIAVLSSAIEDMTRPIDSIRHQAKTVTVGISRPQEALSPEIQAALEGFGLGPEHLKPHDLHELRQTSALIEAVEGAVHYALVGARSPSEASEAPPLQVAARHGAAEGVSSRYDRPRSASGAKRAALRLQRLVWHAGPAGDESMVVAPVFGATNRCEGLVLLQLRFFEEAPTPQKLSILRELGTRYDEIVDLAGEAPEGGSVEDVVARATPREIVLAPVQDLVGIGGFKSRRSS